ESPEQGIHSSRRQTGRPRLVSVLADDWIVANWPKLFGQYGAIVFLSSWRANLDLR
ncbi:unnamed protein product, partial [Amoebophrya sp. A120]